MLRRRLTAANGRQVMDRLPLELLELLLLRTFVKLFTDHYKSQFNVRRVSVQRSYSALAAVCYNWWQTMNGWPQSPTGHWFRHQLHLCIKRVSHVPFSVIPKLRCSIPIATTTKVLGVTESDNKLYFVCEHLDEIFVVDLSAPDRRLPSIRLVGLQEPNDIVACTETRQLYVANVAGDGCIWRVSADGRRVEKWKTWDSTEFRTMVQHGTGHICWSLSTRFRRLLVTTDRHGLVLYGPEGVVMRKLTAEQCCGSSDQAQSLLVQHAVETAHGTFIVLLLGRLDPQSKPVVPTKISEIDSSGREVRFFTDSKLLYRPVYLALDSGGRSVFVARSTPNRLLVLTDRLKPERVVEGGSLSDGSRAELLEPTCVYFAEHCSQLVVGGSRSVCVFDVKSFENEHQKKSLMETIHLVSKCVVM